MEIRLLQVVFKFERCFPAVSPFPSPIRMFYAARSGKPAQSVNGIVAGNYGINKRKHESASSAAGRTIVSLAKAIPAKKR